MTQPDTAQTIMTPRDYFLYAVMVFGWSTSWIMLKQQLGVVAPEVSLFWRYLAAALLMFGLSAVMRQQLRYGARDHLRFLALGLCLFSANFLLFYYAGSYGASGLLAVVFSTASLIIVLMVALASRRMPKWKHLLAAVNGISGVLLLYLPELQTSQTALLSLGLCLGGTLFFCIGNLVSAATQRAGLPVMGASTWGMAYGAGLLGLFALANGSPFIIEFTPVYLLSLAWLVVISSVITFACYLTLVGRIGPGRAGYATVMFPAFALLISTAFESYQWTAFALAGLGLVVTGNIIMLRSRR
jgi:drug/metabolite transporter (DMT)-like permease